MKKKENNAKGGEAADAAEETDTAAAAAADSANPASTPPPRPAPGLKAGTRVELQGLKAKPELNGQKAAVKSFDASSGRYKVKLEDGRGPFSLKAQNLRPLPKPPAPPPPPKLEPGARVWVRGLTAKPELNGQRGVVEKYNAGSGRWTVALEDGRGGFGWGPFSLRPQNLRLIPRDGPGLFALLTEKMTAENTVLEKAGLREEITTLPRKDNYYDRDTDEWYLDDLHGDIRATDRKIARVTRRILRNTAPREMAVSPGLRKSCNEEIVQMDISSFRGALEDGPSAVFRYTAEEEEAWEAAAAATRAYHVDSPDDDDGKVRMAGAVWRPFGEKRAAAVAAARAAEAAKAATASSSTTTPPTKTDTASSKGGRANSLRSFGEKRAAAAAREEKKKKKKKKLLTSTLLLSLSVDGTGEYVVASLAPHAHMRPQPNQEGSEKGQGATSEKADAAAAATEVILCKMLPVDVASEGFPSSGGSGVGSCNSLRVACAQVLEAILDECCETKACNGTVVVTVAGFAERHGGNGRGGNGGEPPYNIRLLGALHAAFGSWTEQNNTLRGDPFMMVCYPPPRSCSDLDGRRAVRVGLTAGLIAMHHKSWRTIPLPDDTPLWIADRPLKQLRGEVGGGNNQGEGREEGKIKKAAAKAAAAAAKAAPCSGAGEAWEQNQTLCSFMCNRMVNTFCGMLNTTQFEGLLESYGVPPSPRDASEDPVAFFRRFDRFMASKMFDKTQEDVHGQFLDVEAYSSYICATDPVLVGTDGATRSGECAAGNDVS